MRSKTYFIYYIILGKNEDDLCNRDISIARINIYEL
jgi:hypothetical protein